MKSNRELKNFLSRIRDCFWHVICLESYFARVSFCDICGSFLGCRECVIHLEKCPMRRKDFNVKCTGCGSVTDVPKNANIVPGLSTLSMENGVTTVASNQDPKNS